MQAIGNVLWLSVSRLLADIFSFLLFIAVARDFGLTGTGSYSYAFAIGTLVAQAAAAGFEEFGIREYVSAAAEERQALWSKIITAQGAQLSLAMIGFILFLLIDHGRSASVTIVLELTLFQVAAAVAHTLFVPAMAAQAMMAPALLELVCRFGAILVALVLVLMRTPVPFPIALLSFPIAAVLLLVFAYRNSVSHGARWRLDLRPSGLRETWRHTLPFAGSEALNQVYARTDLLMIAYFLGQERVGLYATDIKFVEVGIIPLVLFGTAVYPLLTTLAAAPEANLVPVVRDFCRIQLALSGWLAVGMSLLVPMLIVPLFGHDFAAARQLLPWFSLLALIKGAEVALYRLLYSVHRQSVYLRSLVGGTLLIACLNLILVPTIGLLGAVQATVLSTCCVVLMSVGGLSEHLPWREGVQILGRLGATLALTWVLVKLADIAGAAPWIRALLGCCAFPALAVMTGLVPNPARTALFARRRSIPGIPGRRVNLTYRLRPRNR